MKILLILLLTIISLYASPKQILLLQSYNKGLKWSDDISKGVEDVLSKRDKYELTTEYMDSKKNNSLEYQNIVYELFVHKLKSRHYDVLIVADNYAIDFVLKYKEKLFKNTQIIFTGLDKDAPGIDVEKAIKNNIPVVFENKQVTTNINFIIDSFPNLKTLYIINDLTLSSKLINNKIKTSIKKIAKNIEVKFIFHGNVEQIKKDVKKLPKNSVILFGSLFINDKGEYIPYHKVNNLIKESPHPVFALTDSHFGRGVVGGLLSSGYEQGYDAALWLERLLLNKNIKAKAKPSEVKWQFDYKILKKYHLDNLKIPDDAILINSPRGFFESNRELIDIAFIVFPIVILFLILLVIGVVKKMKLEKKLLIQQKLSEAQLSNIESLVFWIDSKGIIKGCNNSFELFVNKIQSEILGENIKDILNYFHEFNFKDKLFTLDYFDFEYDQRVYMVKNRFIKDENNETEIVTIITDITDKKQAEINKQFIIQQSKLTEVGEMLSALVHQWKTPLVTLSAVAHKMYYYNKNNKLTTKEINKYFEVIMEQVIFMGATMDSFRAFIKPSTKPIKFDISNGIKEILNILETSLKYSNINIEYVNILEKKIFIWGYPNEFKQVILNLINNSKDSILSARKKNIDGGNITIILTQIEESVKIKIVDDGIGLSDKIIEKVFEPYFTTKKDGDGIGLYMAKLIIEKKMHGKLNAYVQEIGAKFLITLPKLENEDDENITT